MLLKPHWKNLLSRLPICRPNRRGSRSPHYHKSGYVQLSTGDASVERLEDRALLATISWDGGAGTLNWNDANNWSGDVLPGTSDDVVINFGANDFTVSITTATSVHSLNSHAAIAVSNTTLTLVEGSTTAALSLTNGALAGSAEFTVTGSMTNSGGTLNEILLILAATSDSTWVGNLSLNNGSLVENHGLLQTTTDVTWSGDASSSLHNYGTLRKSGGLGESRVSLPFYNHGLLELQAGTLVLGFGGSSVFNEGQIVGSAGTSLSLQGVSEFTASSTIDVNEFVVYFAPSLITIDGQYRAVSTIIANSPVAFRGEVLGLGDLWIRATTVDLTQADLAPGATTLPSLTLLSGTLRAAEDFTVAGVFESSNGTLDAAGGHGSLVLPNGAGATSITLSGYTLVNPLNQTLILSTLAATNGSLVENHGLLQATTDVTWSGDASSSLHNYGTLRKSGGLGESRVSLPFYNHGLLELQAGTLVLGFGGSSVFNEGQIVGSAGTSLSLQGVSEFTASSQVDVDEFVVYFAPSLITIDGQYRANGTTIANSPVAFRGEVLGLGDLWIRATTFDLTQADLAPGATTLPSLTLLSGTLRAADDFTVAGVFESSNGTLDAAGGHGSLTFPNEVTLNANLTVIDFSLINAGNAIWSGGEIRFFGTSSFTNLATATFDDRVDGIFGSFDGGCQDFTNAGLFVKSGGTGTTFLRMELINSGEVRIEQGNLNIVCGYVQIVGGGGGGGSTGTISGNFVGEVSISNPGELNLEPMLTPPTPVTAYTQTVTGMLVEQIGGLIAGLEYGQIVVNGSVNLDGTLVVDLINGFVPQIGNQFVVIDNRGTNAIQGTFVGLPEGAEFTSDLSRFQITYAGSTGNDVVLTYLGVANAPPVAHDDEVGTNEDSAVTFDVLANDTDAQDNIVASLTTSLSSPGSGILIDNGNGSFTFDPAGAFETLATSESAQVSFDYEIMDAFGETDTATVFITINGVNDAPAVANAGSVTVDEGQTATNTGTWSDIDASDVVTLSASVGSVIKNANGTWSWSLNTADGPDDSQTVVITANDGNGGIVTTTFNLTVNNVAPTAVDDAFSAFESGMAQTLNLLGNDSDPAGVHDPLTISGVNTTGTIGQVTLASGQVSYSPNGQFESLGVGETATDSFIYSISDGDGGTATATVIITIMGENDAPTATGTLSDMTVNQNAANSVINLSNLFHDVDANDTLTITAVSSSNNLVTASVSGHLLTLDYQTNQNGTATITVTATDGSGASVNVTFEVAVLSPNHLANGVIQLIRQWQADGKINGGIANSMIVKVMNSLMSYDRGNLTAAGNQLGALKNQINAMVKSASLTSDDATLAVGLIDELYDAMTP